MQRQTLGVTARGQSRTPDPWHLVLVGAAVTASFFAFGGSRPVQASIYVGLNLAAVAALVAGVRHYKPSDPVPWMMLVAGVALYAVANVVWPSEPNFPSIADAVMLVAYAFLIVGLFRLGRARDKVDHREWIDTAIISVGLAVLAFVFIIEPFLTFEAHSRLTRAVLVAYPLLGMVMMATIVRMFLRGARSPAFWMLAIAIIGQLVADTQYSFAIFNGWYDYGGPYFAGWMLSWVFFGAAALHPSMKDLGRPGEADATHHRARMAVLGCTAVIPPSVDIVGRLTGADIPVAGVSAGSILLFILVFARMSGLNAETTERRRELEEANEKMIENKLAVEMARRAADKANTAKSQYLSRMSHELRTPLNAILGFSQLLGMDDLDDSQRESVQQIEGAGRHLLALVNEVLDIAKIEEGLMTLSIEPVQVKVLVDEVTSLMRPLVEVRNIDLDVSISPSITDAEVLADRQRLKQVLLNLLSNAVKYNRDRGRVVVSCVEEGDDIRIEVADTGPGLTEAQMQRLFVAFDRLGAESGATEGTGLGLALSKSLVEAMDGRLGVRSQPQQGTTFFVRLQRHRREPSPVDVEDNREGVAVPAVERILLCIDDNASSLALIERILEQRPKVRVRSATTGRDGVRMAHERPDAILLDVNLPDINGYEVLASLRSDPVTRDIPTVVVSAAANRGLRERFIAAGAAAYLTKPVEVGSFLDVIDRALSEKAVT